MALELSSAAWSKLAAPVSVFAVWSDGNRYCRCLEVGGSAIVDAIDCTPIWPDLVQTLVLTTFPELPKPWRFCESAWRKLPREVELPDTPKELSKF